LKPPLSFMMKHIVLSLYTPPPTASDAIEILIDCSFRALQKSNLHRAELWAFEGSGLILDAWTAMVYAWRPLSWVPWEGEIF
jgi:hypothetical protein